MELEEMKNLWEGMSQRLNNQKTLTDQLVIEMTQLKYNSKTNFFRNKEFFGLAVAYTMNGIVIYSFESLDTWYLKTTGIVMIIILGILPLFSIDWVKGLRKIELTKSSYKEVLEQFYKTQKRIKQIESIGLIISPFLFVSSSVFFSKIIGNEDLFKLNMSWTLITSIVLIFIGTIYFIIISNKKKRKQLKFIEQLLKDLKH
ncbi:hypothetical protein [Pareuzebyella sediminis]|uniref:hypothetical protein n=1 Tax=Pareuzebyella sediminis TaxID=2607998 RepID=UPI0011EF7A58|nr:hypothetical protein [Pareuzebyella sediminis]